MRSVWLFYHRRKNLFGIRLFVYKYKAPKPIPSDLNKNKKTKETVSGAENGKEGVIIIKFGAPKPYVKRHSKKPHTLNRGQSRFKNRFTYVTHLPTIRKYTNIFLRICQVLKVKIVIIC